MGKRLPPAVAGKRFAGFGRRGRAGAVRRAAAPAAELTAYNAYLASLDPSRMFTGSDRR
jgi:hypothetical protein